MDFLIKKLYSKNKDVIIEMSDNQIFSDEDKDYIETAINKIENEPNFDYYDIENDNDYEL
mgnify:CR=1 FL=1